MRRTDTEKFQFRSSVAAETVASAHSDCLSLEESSEENDCTAILRASRLTVNTERVEKILTEAFHCLFDFCARVDVAGNKVMKRFLDWLLNRQTKASPREGYGENIASLAHKISNVLAFE